MTIVPLLSSIVFITAAQSIENSHHTKLTPYKNICISINYTKLDDLYRQNALFETSNEFPKFLTIITYGNDNIIEYSALSFVINSMYSYYNKYLFRIYTPQNGGDHETDQRWNRVKIFENILNGTSNNYYVWIDADMIILDFSYKLENIIAMGASYDIIISSELHAETGVANTGILSS